MTFCLRNVASIHTIVFVPLSCSVIGVIAVNFRSYSIILCAIFHCFFSVLILLTVS